MILPWRLLLVFVGRPWRWIPDLVNGFLPASFVLRNAAGDALPCVLMLARADESG
jgi:hypothetical protein